MAVKCKSGKLRRGTEARARGQRHGTCWVLPKGRCCVKKGGGVRLRGGVTNRGVLTGQDGQRGHRISSPNRAMRWLQGKKNQKENGSQTGCCRRSRLGSIKGGHAAVYCPPPHPTKGRFSTDQEQKHTFVGFKELARKKKLNFLQGGTFLAQPTHNVTGSCLVFFCW